jgi:putative Mg2+ transporter-C (MgtC) family protein
LLLLALIVILGRRQESDNNILWEELTAGLTNDDQLLGVFFRLFAAILLGGPIGRPRVSPGKPAGVRTHTLVCLGTAVILLSCSAAALSPEGVSRVIQGIVTGIGFIGAGSILQLSEEHLIHGLTASVRLWTTAAVGIALITAVLTILILAVLAALERRIEKRLRLYVNGRLTNQGRE